MTDLTAETPLELLAHLARPTVRLSRQIDEAAAAHRKFDYSTGYPGRGFRHEQRGRCRERRHMCRWSRRHVDRDDAHAFGPLGGVGGADRMCASATWTGLRGCCP